MALLRARIVATLPTPTQPSTLYIVDTANPKQKSIHRTDDSNVKTDLGLRSGFMVNRKLLAAA